MSLAPKKSLPPGPRGLPFVGSTYDLRRDPLGFLQRLARDYGDIAHFRVGRRHVYQLNHPDLIKDVLVTSARKFHKTGLIKQGKPILGNGLLLSEDEFHLRQRRLVQPALNRQHIANYAPIVIAAAKRVSEQWRDGDVIDMSQWMLNLSLNIVTQSLFSFEIDSQVDEVRAALTTVVEHFNRFLTPSASWLSHVPTARNRRFHKAKRFLDGIVFDMIAKARQRKKPRHDLLSMLLAAQDEEGDGKGMSDQQVRDEAMTLFAAGHETVAMALTWTWYLLSLHPSVEAKLHEEWKTVLAGREPAVEDLPKLTFTEMVIAESMRMYPPLWALSRILIEDHQIGDYFVPAGSTIGISQYVMQRDARYFADPNIFDPMRWIGEEKAKRPKYSYFPFGGGPRLCVGEPMAWMEIMIALATMGQSWMPRLLPGASILMLPRVTLRPTPGMPMVVHRRSVATSGSTT